MRRQHPQNKSFALGRWRANSDHYYDCFLCFLKRMTGIIHTDASVWLMIFFSPFSGTEGGGDEDNGDNGNVALRTISACSEPLGSTDASWCHLSSKIEFFFFVSVQSFHPVCHHSNKKKSSLITEAWNKEIPQLCMALEVTFFFPSFLSLNLCMSLWIHCSHTVEQRQSYRKRWNEKAVWGDIESQVYSTPDAGAKLVFSLLNFSCLSKYRWTSRCGDGESESR